MHKHRKTLKEKKRADLHHKFYTAEPLDKIFIDQHPISVKSPYPYLMQDVLKTGILTAGIVAVEVILFFLLKKQILVLPMVKY